ncbi:MAG: trypsin-like peptidase domain-containing protein [Chloroflexi bacterium]|nr:trypsin-like peptidase domain-containing protein [Chloroflexota bacterium]
MNKFKGKIALLLVMAVITAGAYAAGSGLRIETRNAQASPALFNEDTITGIYDTAIPAVVEIRVVEKGTGPLGRFSQSALGSGFLVDTQGNILTNNHVVDGATIVKVVFRDGSTVDGTVAGKDKNSDLAVVKVDGSAVSGIKPLELADSSLVKAGQIAIALGSPYGWDGTITVGVVSGLERAVTGIALTGMIQTDAAINPGNSGGPLLNSQGQVIGINTAIESELGSRGIGFAVTSNVARSRLADLIAGRQIARPWLGISGLALTRDLSQELGLTVDRGIYLVTVLPDSPAEKAGLRQGGEDGQGNPQKGGDVIIAADGKKVASVTDLASYLNAGKKPGDTVVLGIIREGSPVDIPVTLGTWPDSLSEPAPFPHPEIPGR